MMSNRVDVDDAHKLVDRVDAALTAELEALAVNDYAGDSGDGRLRRSTLRLELRIARIDLEQLKDGTLSPYDELRLGQRLADLRRRYPPPSWEAFLHEHPELG